MSATLIIVFREVLEAALVVGIVLAATQGVPRRMFWIGLGLASGIAGAMLVAAFAEVIANTASGMGQELFNAAVLFTAVIMLGWHNVWMSRTGRAMTQELKAVGAAIRAAERPVYALAIVIGVAILREGSEIVLFLYGIAAAEGTQTTSMFLGGVLGLALGVAAGAAIYFGLIRFAGKHLFAITGILILLLAAGMAAQGANFLVQAGYLPALGHSIWDSSRFIPDRSALGNLLHVLIGYTARPEGIQLVFYIATISIIGGLMFALRTPRKLVTAAASLTIGIMLFGASGFSGTAKAADLKVYSPIVEEGEYAIEVRGNVTHDNNPAKDGTYTQVTEFEITPTSYWHTAIFGEMKKEPFGSLQYKATGWENIFQLTPQGKYWADLGFYAEYEWGQKGGAADEVEWKILAQKNVGRMSFIINPIFETKVGGNRSGGVEFKYAAQAKWRYMPQIEPAIELYGEFGDIGHFGQWRDQRHQIGPVILGKFNMADIGALKYELGYLFGVTKRGSPDGAFKFSLEWERHF